MSGYKFSEFYVYANVCDNATLVEPSRLVIRGFPLSGARMYSYTRACVFKLKI